MIDPLSVFLLLISASTPILFAALGELVVERAGVLNLGVEGMMITGALAGFAAAYASGNPFLGFLVAAVAGAAISLLFAALTQLFLANQVASGLALTLFGLVLAIGIVVDDAIVVVENVERHIEHGATPLEAAHLAMREVSGPIIAIALVLCAVFVPMAFLTGVTGQFYKQFAVTIAISTVISAINSLTLSPALAARLLKPHGAPKDMPSRLIDRLFGWLFRPFNRFFKRSSGRYEGAVSWALGRRGAVFAVYAVLLLGAGFLTGRDIRQEVRVKKTTSPFCPSAPV